MKGHSYYLFDPAHLDGAARVDADGKGAPTCRRRLGLAQPLTAEGILPAVHLGPRCAPRRSSRARRRATRRASPPIPSSPTTGACHRLRETAAAFARPSAPARRDGGGARRARARRLLSAPRLRGRAVATGFAWMFSGARLPAPALIDLALASANSGAGAARTEGA